jgi:hypothetical protein
MPNEAHGDDRHIVMDDLQQAAEADGITVGEVVRNIQGGFETAERAGEVMGRGGNQPS